MKKILKKLVSWMTVLGNLCVFLGSFVTYVKGYSWFYDYEVGSVALFHVFESDDGGMIKVALVIMWVSAIVSLVALKLFNENTGMATSITLVVVAFVGEFCYDHVKEVMLLWMNEGSYKIERGMGAVMLEKAYIVIIVAAFLALVMDIYSNYIERNLKEKLNSVIVPMGSSSCPKCGKTISVGSKFCGACGFSLETLNCPKCGAKRGVDSQFCKECGERLPVLGIKEENKSILVGWGMKQNEGAKEVSEKHWVCGKCGEENSTSSRHCQKCGGGR